MTDDQPRGGTDTALPASPADTPLGRYQARLRRQRTVYFSIVSAIVVVLVVVVAVAWSRGETNNTTLRTAGATPPGLPTASASSAVQQTWTTGDRAAIGTPQWGGTVVVSGEHTVRGVNARTGATTWSYTRSDRRLCTAAQLSGVTVAVYALHGNCDEVTGLDSGTGERRWTRTLNMDGMPVNGTPVFTTDEQGSFTTLVVRTSSVVYALDPSSGYNRWTYTRYGCTITGTTLGTAGGLISQTCSSQVVCGKLKFCGVGPQLFLLPNGFSRDDAMKDTNPDHIVWNLMGVRATPASADTVVSAVSGSRLVQYDAQKGTTVATTALAAPAGTTPITATPAGDSEVLGIGGRLYALDQGVATPRWSVAVNGVASVVQSSAGETPALATTRITVPTASGAATLNATTGATASTSTFAATASGGTVRPLGSGFLVTTSGATSAFA